MRERTKQGLLTISWRRKIRNQLAVPFLDIRGQVESGGEKGLLGIAFHPRYRGNGMFFVDYTACFGRARRCEEPNRVVGQPYGNYNGGQLAFGPDGYLYIGMGDGGAANDPQGHAQNPGSLLGQLQRIDVDRANGARPHGIPKDKPFVNKEGICPEIRAHGLRNPAVFVRCAHRYTLAGGRRPGSGGGDRHHSQGRQLRLECFGG